MPIAEVDADAVAGSVYWYQRTGNQKYQKQIVSIDIYWRLRMQGLDDENNAAMKFESTIICADVLM